MASKRILVVDDESDVVIYLSALLRDAGYVVDAAADGQMAIDAVRQSAPDLISLDITMPEKSGVRFYREMREDEALKSIPIVIVTGVTSTYDGPEGAGSFEKFLSTRGHVPAPDAFMEKPVDPEAYVAKVRELIGAA
jgi:CheY-like chemotaxis protein